MYNFIYLSMELKMENIQIQMNFLYCIKIWSNKNQLQNVEIYKEHKIDKGGVWHKGNGTKIKCFDSLLVHARAGLFGLLQNTFDMKKEI